MLWSPCLFCNIIYKELNLLNWSSIVQGCCCDSRNIGFLIFSTGVIYPFDPLSWFIMGFRGDVFHPRRVIISVLGINKLYTISVCDIFEKKGQFAIPETGENWLGLVNSCVYYARHYSVEFKAHVERWNPLNKTVLSAFSFIWNREPINTLNDCKAQK